MASLTTSVMRKIAGMKKETGLQCLTHHLQLDEIEDDLRKRLHQEFVYENAMYAVKRGLPWSTVVQIAKMAKELLPELRGQEISEVIALIQNRLSNCQLCLSRDHQTILFNFIVDTYVHHQRLYTAVLNGDANIKHKSVKMEVLVPPCPQPLRQGTDIQIWEQQQSLAALQTAELEKQAEILTLRERSEVQMKAILEITFPVEGRLSKQGVEKVVRDFLRAQGDLVMDTMMKEVTLVQELLELRLSLRATLGTTSKPTSNAAPAPVGPPNPRQPKLRKK